MILTVTILVFLLRVNRMLLKIRKQLQFVINQDDESRMLVDLLFVFLSVTVVPTGKCIPCVNLYFVLSEEKLR